MSLTPADLAELAERGISEAEARRQLAQLTGPPPFVALDRACTVGDGIERLDGATQARLEATHAAPAAAGRLTALVPASGAATRMFKDLLAYRDSGRLEPPARAFFDGLPRFAFAAELARALGADLAAADHPRVLDALLADDGLGYAQLPKGLLAFHDYPDGPRTPFEEHLVEAAGLVRDAGGRCRLHFTVSPEHQARFEALAARAAAALGARLGVSYAITFSTQSPGTDTLAVDGAGQPFRHADGRLLLRPAGHGALLPNLHALGADLVLMKNIDNVAVDAEKDETLRWSKILVGRLAELEADAPDDRPLRVCGMVPNTGEPGGGPFWVRGAGGAVTRQIVEAAQVDERVPDQQAKLRGATHFNPVFLACALRDRAGRPHDLERFVDASAAIVTRKSSGGRELVALERPGLWNGAMGGWHTVFVEVPGAVFNPVKTVNDLLRPAHQPRAR